MLCSESVTNFTQCVFEYPQKWCACSTVWSLHSWCHVKPLVSAHILCTPYNHAMVYSVTLFEATYLGCMCVKTVTHHLPFWQKDHNILHILWKDGGGMDTEIRVSRESWPWRRKISCCYYWKCVTFQSWIQHSTNEPSLPTSSDARSFTSDNVQYYTSDW